MRSETRGQQRERERKGGGAKSKAACRARVRAFLLPHLPVPSPRLFASPSCYTHHALPKALPPTREEQKKARAKLEKRFRAFLAHYVRERGCSGVVAFFPHEEEEEGFVAAPDMSYEFRDAELARCEALWEWRAHVRASEKKKKSESGGILLKVAGGAGRAQLTAKKVRGKNGEMPAHAFEGNPNYLWAIETAELECQLRENTLRPGVLSLYASELLFRQRCVESSEGG